MLQGYAAKGVKTDGMSEERATTACIDSVLRIVGAAPDVGKVSRIAGVSCQLTLWLGEIRPKRRSDVATPSVKFGPLNLFTSEVSDDDGSHFP